MGTGAAFSRWGSCGSCARAILHCLLQPLLLQCIFILIYLRHRDQPKVMHTKFLPYSDYRCLCQTVALRLARTQQVETCWIGRGIPSRPAAWCACSCQLTSHSREPTAMGMHVLRKRASYGLAFPRHKLSNIWLLVPDPDGIQSYRMSMVLTKKCVVKLQHTSSKAKGNLLCIIASVSIWTEQKQLALCLAVMHWDLHSFTQRSVHL